MESAVKYEPLRADIRQPWPEPDSNAATPMPATRDNRSPPVQPQYAPPPNVPPGNYGAHPGGYPQYPQYGGMPMAYPPNGMAGPMPMPMPMPPPHPVPMAPYPHANSPYGPPVMYAPPVAPAAGSVPGIVTGPAVGGALVVSRVLMPPLAYVPPILPTDPSLTSKFVARSSSLTSSEKNYTWHGDVGLDDLRNFFVSHTGAPECQMFVVGSHDVQEVQIDANGNRHTHTKRVEDWRFSVDLKPWILAPGEMAGLGIEECVDRFARSKGQMKSMELKKHVVFDSQKYNEYILGVARRKGYPHRVQCGIEYTNHSDKIVLLAPGDWNLCCNSPMMKCLLCVTCLCICWYPLKSCMEEKFHLKQMLSMAITPEQLLAMSQDQVPFW